MQPTQALSEQDLELLHLARAGNRIKTLLNIALLIYLIGFGGWASSIIFSNGTVDNGLFAVITLVCLAAALAIAFRLFRHWQRVIQPLRSAIASNQKRVISGTLTQVESLPKGRLRYVVDGAPLEVDLLLGIDNRASYILRRQLDSFLHLNDVEVELHRIALGPDVTLLLQAHYTTMPQPVRSARTVDRSDQDRANQEAKSTALKIAGCLAVVLALIGIFLFLNSESARAALFGTLALGLCLTAMIPLVVLPRLLRARRSASVVEIQGLVTEVIKSKVRFGRTASTFDVYWYRVGGVLYCPFGSGVEGKAELGQFVKLEFMNRKGRAGDGKLMYFQVIPGRRVLKGATHTSESANKRRLAEDHGPT